MDTNKKYNIQNLSPEKPKWKNLPTKAVRIPEVFASQCIEIARLLDAGGEVEKSREENFKSAFQPRVERFLEEKDLNQPRSGGEKFLEENIDSGAASESKKFLEEKDLSPVSNTVERFLEENNGGENRIAIAVHQDNPHITPAQVINDILELAAKTLDLEHCLNLQSELGKIIEEKREQAKDPRLEQAILYLAGLCDGAESEDGKGFTKFDAGFGNWLAQRIRDKKPLLRTHMKSALEMVHKYLKTQLINHTLPKWDAIFHQYPEHIPHTIEVEGKETLPAKRIEIIGEKVCIYSPYDETGKFQKTAKSIQDYDFINSDKSWRYPLKRVEEILEKFPEPEFCVSEEVHALYALSISQREAEIFAKEQAAAKIANELSQLVQASNLDAPLANGWYLREYQKSGVEWLLAHRKGGLFNGGILGDQMGLGKTLTALVAARSLQLVNSCPILVIAPVSVHESWVREAEKAQIKIEVFSWAKIPNPLESREYLIIADEAHYAQSGESQRAKKLKVLAHHKNCIACWLLTGTPIKNAAPINFLSLLEIVNHPLAADKLEYQRRYCNAHHKVVGNKSIWDNTGYSCLEELSEKTKDVILRRTKQECLSELPEKTRLYSVVEQDRVKAQQYQDKLNNLVADYRRRAKLGKVSKDAEALVVIDYLRKLGSEYKVDAAIAKANQLLEQDEQVVIFTEFVQSAEIIARNLNALLLTGDTKKEDRQQLIDQFQSGENRVFVGTIKAGGIGITLTAASNVIMVDRPWTPGDTEQAEDRCHRLGQKNAVFSHWLQLGQIDYIIDDLLMKKQARIELLLKGKSKSFEIDSPKELAKQILEIL
jgi:Helicase conserved C-terminal domain/SNF2-related domain